MEQEQQTQQADVNPAASTPENNINSGGRTQQTQDRRATDGDADRNDFEALIKGRYKEAFSERVQKIIDGRFKEMQQLKQQNQQLSEQLQQQKDAAPLQPQAAEKTPVPETTAPTKNGGDEKAAPTKEETLAALIESGIDPDIAYAAVHFEKVMDGSVKYGAALAAKQITENIRTRSARPAENGLSGAAGIAVRRSVAGLTPDQRRELAKKSLMGEKVGF